MDVVPGGTEFEPQVSRAVWQVVLTRNNSGCSEYNSLL